MTQFDFVGTSESEALSAYSAKQKEKYTQTGNCDKQSHREHKGWRSMGSISTDKKYALSQRFMHIFQIVSYGNL